jgi:hypothetical protein
VTSKTFQPTGTNGVGVVQPEPLANMLVHATSQDKTTSGKSLTATEYAAFTADWKRDQSITRAQSTLVNSVLDQIDPQGDTSTDKLNSMAANKDASSVDPTKSPVNRSMFGYPF